MVTNLSSGMELDVTPLAHVKAQHQGLFKVVCRVIDMHPKKLSEALWVYNPTNNSRYRHYHTM